MSGNLPVNIGVRLHKIIPASTVDMEIEKTGTNKPIGEIPDLFPRSGGDPFGDSGNQSISQPDFSLELLCRSDHLTA
jgi:hypothetical protein